MESIGILALRRQIRPSSAASITTLPEAVQIIDLNRERCPAGYGVIKVHTCKNGIAIVVKEQFCGSQMS
jgi:hypothetical protein